MEPMYKESPCPICGGNTYSWGTLVGQQLKYEPEDMSLLSKMFSLRARLPARQCDRCGNIQIFSCLAEDTGR
jgi:hypothetical protein